MDTPKKFNSWSKIFKVCRKYTTKTLENQTKSGEHAEKITQGVCKNFTVYYT